MKTHATEKKVKEKKIPIFLLYLKKWQVVPIQKKSAD